MRTRLGMLLIVFGSAVGCGAAPEQSDPSKLDRVGQYACDDFAAGFKAAQTQQARVDLANKVNEWASASKSTGIAAAGAALGRGADGNVAAWKLAADSFAQVCFDRGWSASA